MKTADIHDRTPGTPAERKRTGVRWPHVLCFIALVPVTLCVWYRMGTLLHTDEPLLTTSHAGAFWEAYSAERYALLSRGAGDGGQSRPTKYIVFSLTRGGLGNHMAGVMSVFALSIAWGRVFLHDWNYRRPLCGATYDDLFSPPFSPWSANSIAGSYVSGEDGHLPGWSWSRARRTRYGLPVPKNPDDRKNCTINLTQTGATGDLENVFIDMKGQDPRPECTVLIVNSNQYLVQAVADPGYGAASVGGVPLSEWLGKRKAVETLFAGLFRPVGAVSRRVQNATAQLYPSTGQSVAAHARAWHLRDPETKQKFVDCLRDCAYQSNASTIVVATDIDGFVEETGNTLRPDGIEVNAMAGVSRSGESAKMRHTVEQVQTALVDMLLIGKADVVITSPQSSFSAVAAAGGGALTQRVGGVSCKPILNEPELHVLDCGMTWKVDSEKWGQVYSFLDSNRNRCLS